MIHALIHLARAQWRWWHLPEQEPVRLDPPPRNSYPPLCWDSPRRQARMFAIREERGDVEIGRVYPSMAEWRRDQFKIVRTA